MTRLSPTTSATRGAGADPDCTSSRDADRPRSFDVFDLSAEDLEVLQQMAREGRTGGGGCRSSQGMPAPRAVFLPAPTIWQRIKRWSDWIDDSIIGDAIGVIAIFVFLFAALFLGSAVQ